VEALVVVYTLLYVPNIVLTRWLATTEYAPLGRPLTGLEMLPASQILSGLMTLAFVWAAGWWRYAHQAEVMGRRVPCPTRWTVISGLGTSLILVTVPLSLTFPGVSIPFMQLLMRGDILLIAPIVDFVTGRKVRWYSWVALVLVGAGLFLGIRARGGLNLPPLAILTVALYVVGYFSRLFVMSKVSKTGAEGSVRGYFVEEKMVGIPMAIVVLAVLSALGQGDQPDQLSWGFVGVWSSSLLPHITFLAVTLFLVSVVAAVILLNPRENTFCVALERAGSLLAGVAATYVLAFTSGQPLPTGVELIGAALLVLAVLLLTVAPHLETRRGANTATRAA
jgi:hypothetical protein